MAVHVPVRLHATAWRHAPAERVALAMSLCGARGVQLTTLRRQILELLWESGRPTGAYELIEALEIRDSRPVGPPTVYRALEFLVSQGLVSKIEAARRTSLAPIRNAPMLVFSSSVATAGRRPNWRSGGSSSCLTGRPPTWGSA